jgi:hypothetical protein
MRWISEKSRYDFLGITIVNDMLVLWVALIPKLASLPFRSFWDAVHHLVKSSDVMIR